MYVVRDNEGTILTSCEIGPNYGKEETYDSYESAKSFCDVLNASLFMTKWEVIKFTD